MLQDHIRDMCHLKSSPFSMSMSEFILLVDGHYSHYRLWRIWPIVGSQCNSSMAAAAIVGITSESEVKIAAKRTMASMSSRVMEMAWR